MNVLRAFSPEVLDLLTFVNYSNAPACLSYDSPELLYLFVVEDEKVGPVGIIREPGEILGLNHYGVRKPLPKVFSYPTGYDAFWAEYIYVRDVYFL